MPGGAANFLNGQSYDYLPTLSWSTSSRHAFEGEAARGHGERVVVADNVGLEFAALGGPSSKQVAENAWHVEGHTVHLSSG